MPERINQTKAKKRSQPAAGESSDEEYNENGDDDEEEDSASESEKDSPKKGKNFVVDDNSEEEMSGSTRRRTRQQAKRKRISNSEEAQDLHEEVAELHTRKKSRRTVNEPSTLINAPGERPLRRRAQPVDYRIWRPDLLKDDANSPPPSSTPNRGGRKNGASSVSRQLFNTLGPFGGTGQGASLFGSSRPTAMGGYDSDSSDDDNQLLPTGGGGPSLPTGFGKKDSVSGRPSAVGSGGTPANLGKVTGSSKKLLADADPLGVDPNVDFSKIGGLRDHINQLKEMVSLPLLYPEIFQNLNVTPPRGVLFHGPPGTGKTLLARALAASCSTEGRKISFYMRKGADCLSKWVGEAERQLRLLFEEARNNQPSIIFFDEIDGMYCAY